jgi:hypothetical protein
VYGRELPFGLGADLGRHVLTAFSALALEGLSRSWQDMWLP